MPQDNGSQPRTEQIYVRVTPDEKAAIKQLAGVEGYETYSELVREDGLEPLLQKHARIVELTGTADPN